MSDTYMAIWERYGTAARPDRIYIMDVEGDDLWFLNPDEYDAGRGSEAWTHYRRDWLLAEGWRPEKHDHKPVLWAASVPGPVAIRCEICGCALKLTGVDYA